MFRPCVAGHGIALFLALAPAAAAEPALADPIPCLMEPRQTIHIAAPASGVLDQILVDRGAVVKRGDLLAHLVSSLEEADVASARVKAADDSTIQQKQARRDTTASKLDRLQRLHGTAQFVSPSALDDATADAKGAAADLQAAITQARLNQIDLAHAIARLEQRSVRAPVNGVVTEKSLSVGEYAYEQTHVLTLAETDPLNVEAYLPVSRYGSVRVGEQASVLPEEPIGGTYPATVTVVDQVFDSRSGSFGIRLTLPNPRGKLPANIRCQLKFVP